MFVSLFVVGIESNKNTRGTPWISIPVRNGVFEYDFYTDHEKAYELICWDDLLNGCWYPVTFKTSVFFECISTCVEFIETELILPFRFK